MGAICTRLDGRRRPPIQIVALFEQEDLRGVVLCGHSYGGMVIGGVAR